ncbi:MAG TPA: signal peptidase I [Chloroflexi bacterium]|jgi:signal peptidase I|nr:signal peptidase I [Chloroflexota bacterium]
MIESSSQRRDVALPSNPHAAAWWREILVTLFPAALIVLAVNMLLIQPRVVHGQSMEPSLHNNQRVIIDVISYRFRAPTRGEIVILRLSDRRGGPPLIKRVIGLPGDLVEIRDGSVYLNDRPLDEPYLDQTTPGSMAPQYVPADHVFVLGDNRSSSNDSRYFGVVPLKNIRGRAWLCYWPVEDMGVFR